MDENAYRFLNEVRRQMLNNRGDRDERGGYLLRITITLDSATVGTEPHWSPSAEHVELLPGELWARPTATTDLYDVIAYPHTRGHDSQQLLTSGKVELADLMGLDGVYHRPRRLDLFAGDGTVSRSVLPDDHPAHRYHQWIENLWDELVWQCQYNWIGDLDDSCPPMPSLAKLDDTWRIGLLLRVCRNDVWDEDDELDACFLAGLFDAYPCGTREITAYDKEPFDPPIRVWQRLSLPPQALTARTLANDPDNKDWPPF